MLGLQPYFEIPHNWMAEFSALCAGHTLPQGHSLILISVRVFMTPGLLNADRTNRSFEDFQGPCRESNPEPPVSLHTQAIAPQSAPPIYIQSHQMLPTCV